MCPSHLVKKWAREITSTIPKARAQIIRNLKDILAIDTITTNTVPEYYIISKDRAKLGHAWRSATTFSKVMGEHVCPSCGSLVLDNDGVPVDFTFFTKKKRFCQSCGSPLWQADNTRVRRYAVAEYIKNI